jgi:ABC-type oligopeptide transport system ATPase subunit
MQSKSRLKKSFAAHSEGKSGAVDAVRGISLAVSQGEILGLLGSN